MANFLSNAIGAIGHGVAAGAGTAYDYATPGRGSSRVTNWGENYFVPTPQPPKVNNPGKTTSTPVYTPPSTSNLDAQIAALNAQTRALQNQLAAQPRLPYYNTSAAWATAQKAAQGVVDPVYTDKLNQYLQKEQLGIKQSTEQQQAQAADIQTQLQQALQDVATGRTRTGQDQATQLGDVATNETNYQTNEGRAFDQARTALLGGISNAGLTTSGIGKQQETQAITDRNVASGQQTGQFETARRDINTNATRTFEDLSTTENRSNVKATTDTAASQKALQDFIDNAKLDEQGFRTQNEADRLGALATESGNQYKSQVANFIASLVGSGARAQDIALAQQIYG